MKIEATSSDSHAAIVLRGEFETNAADDFLAIVEQTLKGGQPRISVSLRYVKYINSTALGAVVRARTKCREQDGELVVLQPSKLTREILVSMGLDKVLQVVEDEAAAINLLQGNANPAPEEAAAASAPPDSENQDTVIMFSFHDERDDLIPGKRKHGVGALDSVSDTKLVFHWNPGEHESDAATATAMFRIGGSMRNKLQLKLIRKGFFEGDTIIDSAELGQDGTITVRAHWSKIAETDRAALRRHGEDIAYLNEQANEGP